jgi:hypothetical protein
MTGELPAKMTRIADALRREPETRRTAEFIVVQSRRFLDEWKTHRKLSAERMPLPLPRDQGLHPVGCQLHDCHLSFCYEETDNSYLPDCVEFQVQIEGLLLAGSSLIEMQDHRIIL